MAPSPTILPVRSPAKKGRPCLSISSSKANGLLPWTARENMASASMRQKLRRHSDTTGTMYNVVILLKHTVEY